MDVKCIRAIEQASKVFQMHLIYQLLSVPKNSKTVC